MPLVFTEGSIFFAFQLLSGCIQYILKILHPRELCLAWDGDMTVSGAGCYIWRPQQGNMGVNNIVHKTSDLSKMFGGCVKSSTSPQQYENFRNIYLLDYMDDDFIFGGEFDRYYESLRVNKPDLYLELFKYLSDQCLAAIRNYSKNEDKHRQRQINCSGVAPIYHLSLV